MQQEGFTVTSVAASKNSIGFSGNIAAVEKAFQTQIHNYSLNGETHFANAAQISIPSSLAGTVSSVRGLDDFRLKPRMQFHEEQGNGQQSALYLGSLRSTLRGARRFCHRSMT